MGSLGLLWRRVDPADPEGRPGSAGAHLLRRPLVIGALVVDVVLVVVAVWLMARGDVPLGVLVLVASSVCTGSVLTRVARTRAAEAAEAPGTPAGGPS